MSVQLWPPMSGVGVDPKTFSWPGGRWDGPITPEVAKALPGIARGIGLISGQMMQMPMDDYRDLHRLPRPLLLEQPDPDESRAWFVQVHIEDYLLNGNALHYVTTRDSDGWPATAVWIPAAWCHITRDPQTRRVEYWVGGIKLRRQDVVHVKRGADRMNPGRGIGVVEQHLDVLGKIRDEHAYEAEVLDGAAVPSVAVIAPNPRLSTEEADEAKDTWMEKFGGPAREPAILPAGTQVIPLGWSPSDAQLVEARKLSLLDAANMLNLDGYWLGAPSGSMTYRSPGPMYLNLLRQTIGPIKVVVEDVWSMAWLPRGRRVQFDQRVILGDDMATMVATADKATAAELWSLEEGREYMGMPPELPDGTMRTVTTPVAVEDDPADDPEDPDFPDEDPADPGVEETDDDGDSAADDQEEAS